MNKQKNPARAALRFPRWSCLLCLFGVLATVPAQSHKSPRVVGPRRAPAVAACPRTSKRFEVGSRLHLKFLRCSGHIELPELNFIANSLQIGGDSITLGSEDGTELRGEASAFALSQYCINANLGLFFNRSQGLTFTDPNWKAPTVFSLRLKQISAKKFALYPAPGANLQPQTGGEFTCEEVDSTAL